MHLCIQGHTNMIELTVKSQHQDHHLWIPFQSYSTKVFMTQGITNKNTKYTHNIKDKKI